jgi:hypothetical protein
MEKSCAACGSPTYAENMIMFGKKNVFFPVCELHANCLPKGAKCTVCGSDFDRVMVTLFILKDKKSVCIRCCSYACKKQLSKERGIYLPDFKNMCRFCGKVDCVLKKCGECKTEEYCSKECQTADWKRHKKVCVKKK